MNDQKPKRQRLTPRQRKFLHLVYDCNFPINVVLNDLNIRVLTLQRWLTKPVFVNRLRMYVCQYYIEAQLELARSAPSAINGLIMSSRESHTQADLRRACTDLLNFHAQLAKIAGSKPTKNGSAMDNFGAFWEQLGASLAQYGAHFDAPRLTDSPEKQALNPKNEDLPEIVPKFPVKPET